MQNTTQQCAMTVCMECLVFILLSPKMAISWPISKLKKKLQTNLCDINQKTCTNILQQTKPKRAVHWTTYRTSKPIRLTRQEVGHFLFANWPRQATKAHHTPFICNMPNMPPADQYTPIHSSEWDSLKSKEGHQQTTSRSIFLKFCTNTTFR